jgi:hypothetical protein
MHDYANRSSHVNLLECLQNCQMQQIFTVHDNSKVKKCNQLHIAVLMSNHSNATNSVMHIWFLELSSAE